MSNRRYYEDAYTTQFQAKVVEKIAKNKRQGLVLDETYFYPESGGQPADFGTINGRLRLIDIENYDLTACGGTHVNRTGSVGLIKIIKQEKRGEKTRIEFCCGSRALHDYTQKHTIVSDLTTELTIGSTEIISSITRMRQENKDAHRTIKKQKEALMANRAQSLYADSIQLGTITLIKQTFADHDSTDLRALAAQMVKQESVIVLFGQSGKRTQLLFSRSAQASADMNQLLKAALTKLGDGAGGGSPNFAQGGGPAHTSQEVMAALDTAQSLLVDWLSQ